ncbi:hypothetical protein [Eisenibacter elegans]|uniref:hypothetical protein n=1 Tax=Eisenibacter elegans TaxID=997 RepID=UPI00041B034A|nr:hypothetical protein [Eisenibacter elegans]
MMTENSAFEKVWVIDNAQQKRNQQKRLEQQLQQLQLQLALFEERFEATLEAAPAQPALPPQWAESPYLCFGYLSDNDWLTSA